MAAIAPPPGKVGNGSHPTPSSAIIRSPFRSRSP